MSEERIEVYRDAAGEWRWTHKEANNEPIANSGEGYTRKGKAVEMAERHSGGSIPVRVVERD